MTTRAVQVVPDKYAEQKRVAKFLGYPTIAAEAMPDQTARDAKLQEIQQNTADHPELQQRFTDEDFAILSECDDRWGCASAFCICNNCWFSAFEY